ncbi:disease resistance protein RPM1-like [Miscanthus floridulus]|uniref:disease resistance protein RPM1-like n=1 Tax=Miscanthus floridulus TaxID=154761 RepID=UPI003457AA1E
MAEAALLALSKIGFYLAGEAATFVATKFSNLTELPNIVQRVRRQLLMMNLFIRKTGALYLSDELLKGWISEVRMLAYRVEDVMDNFSYHYLRYKNDQFLKRLSKGINYTAIFSGISDELIQIEKEIVHVSMLKDQWLRPVHELLPTQIHNSELQFPQYSVPQFMKDEDLVGIEKNSEQLTKWLRSDTQDLKVVSVCGMGGIGKTTLIANVYEKQRDNFKVLLWLTISQTYKSVEALLRKLLEMTRADSDSMEMGKRKSEGIDSMDILKVKTELRAVFGAKKYLVVLDDIWNPQVYESMRDVFEDSKNGSCIVITTRKEDVAALASKHYQLKLSPLGLKDALSLLCTKAFPYNDSESEDPSKVMELATDTSELLELANDIAKKSVVLPVAKCPLEMQVLAVNIAKKCGGLPLAIVSIGSLLSTRKLILPVWKQIYDQLPSELEKYAQVRGILSLSYYDLPGELRNCFLYCSMFPEDYPLPREKLVRLWIAEGFVVKKGNSTLEEVAEGCLMELIHRNMLQVVDNDELGGVSTFRMHDILRELALTISKVEMFGIVNDFGAVIQMDRDVRRLSAFRWRKMKNDASKMKFPRLRTLMASETIVMSIPSILSESKYLTVLELQDSEVTTLPASIGHLFNLRYIGLRNTGISVLPESIENLINLQTLDVKSTNIRNLPHGIVKLTKLRHILADRYADVKQSEFRYFVGVEAPIGLSNLEELQTLETVQSSIYLAEQLENMMQLRSVWIENITTAHCSKICKVLSMMPLLDSLLLSASNVNEPLSFEDLKPTSTKLHRLIVRGCWAGRTLKCPMFEHHGGNLKYLALSGCHLGGEDPLVFLASHAPHLSYLRLNNINSKHELVVPADSFTHLKTLVLMGLHDVSFLDIGHGSLPVIEGIYITSLPKLATVPQGIENCHCLKKLWLLGLHVDFKAQWNNKGMKQKMQHVPEIRI